MGKEVKVKLTVEQLNRLMNFASVNKVPPKLGETNYRDDVSGIANEDIWGLFKKLIGYSPLYKTKDRVLLFGPMDCYEEITVNDGKKGYRIIDHGRQVEVRLSESDISGAAWCAVMALHPASHPSVGGAAFDRETIWNPILEKLKKTNAVRKEIGLDKATPKRWDDDPEPKAEPEGNGSSQPVSEEMAESVKGE